LAVTDAVEGEQRFQAKLLNSRVDELSLALDPPTVTGSKRLSTFELRYRPGNVVTGVEDAQRDVLRQFPQNYTQQAYMEQQQSEIRVQRITGQNEAAMQGVPTAQNPMARSAAGANLQASASISRLVHIVENAENLALEPAIMQAWEWDKLYLNPAEMMVIAKAGGVDPVELFTSTITPKCRAGSRMKSQQVLAQMFPMVMQALSNAGVLQQLSQQGQTVDWQEMFRVLFDAAGYTRRAQLIRPMTKQEMQAMQQANQAQMQMAKMKSDMQDRRMAQLSEMQDSKGVMDFVKQTVNQIIKQQHEKGIATDQNLVQLLDMLNQNMMSQQTPENPSEAGTGETQVA